MSLIQNLNHLTIENADGPAEPLTDYRAISTDGSTTVLFKNLEQELIRRIDEADVVVGCVAWLTSTPILHALARKVAVAIVVQKEDFLRPDLEAASGWKHHLRQLYNKLPVTLTRWGWCNQTVLGGMSCGSDPTLDAVRCVGNHNSQKNSAFPRAHHKFVVFGRQQGFYEEGDPRFTPYAVWTGSFNFTKNATRSFENAIVCTDPNIVQAFVWRGGSNHGAQRTA